MRSTLRTTLALIALALALGAAAPAPSARSAGLTQRIYLPLLFNPGSPLQTAEQRRLAEEVVELVNQYRAQAGCQPLAIDGDLTEAAQLHSADMAERGYFSHTAPPPGKDWDERIREAGYTGGTLGENIAAGQPDAEAVMDTWMGSPGHRQNILNCAYRDIGVGFFASDASPYGEYWTQDFGG